MCIAAGGAFVPQGWAGVILSSGLIATLQLRHIGSIDLVREGPQFLLVIEFETLVPRQKLLDDTPILFGFKATGAV